MDSEELFSESDSSIEAFGDDNCYCLDSDLFNSPKVDYDDEFSFDVLSSEDIVNDMLDSIKEVNTIVKIPPTITRILLNHFKWDKEKLYERYYGGDPESLFKEAHVVNPESSVLKNEMTSVIKKTHELCEICFRKLPFNLMASLACGHRFCTECWTIYLTTKIMDQGEVQYISCFAVGCDILVDDQTIMDLVTDSKVKLKYQHLITNNFIACNRLLKYCPKPGCSNVIKVQYVDARPVICLCNHTFCFRCSEDWHEPITCQLLQKWQKKNHDDSATLNWMVANTKECPHCNIRIEKNGGCNHMVCMNKSCKHEFCWLCLRAWHSHNFQWDKCNRYNEDISKTKEMSRSALEKYLFYYDRYMNHIQSLKFENELYASVRAKMEEMVRNNMSWNEAQFLKRAVDVLCQCRQTLMYTYVFAYYLIKNNASAIFEANQSDLQNAVEQLSAYLERDITEDCLLTMKQTVQDKFRYCDIRRKVLLDHVIEGHEKNNWKFSEY